MWEMITWAMAGLGSAAAAATEEDLQELQSAGTAAGAAGAAGTEGGAGGSGTDGASSGDSQEEAEELVEYEGMLVSAAAAQRRRCGRVHPPGRAGRGRRDGALHEVAAGAGARCGTLASPVRLTRLACPARLLPVASPLPCLPPRFFSSLIQRAAKMHRRLRGGSMSMLLVTPGVPASGE